MNKIKQFVCELICKLFGHDPVFNHGVPKWKKYVIRGIEYHDGIQFTTWYCKRCGLNSEDHKPFPPENEFKFPSGVTLTNDYYEVQFPKLEKMVEDFERALRPKGIYITKIVQPEHGAVILMHCSTCKKTLIEVNKYALKPVDGEGFKMETEYCGKGCAGIKAQIKFELIRLPDKEYQTSFSIPG